MNKHINISISYLQALQARNFGITSKFLWENGVIPYEIDTNSFGMCSLLIHCQGLCYFNGRKHILMI